MKEFKPGGKYYKSNLHVALALIGFIFGTVGAYAALCALMAF
ncbi:hypothetical protein AALA22_03375 [Anaerovoracaceae bacterium 41-7]|nr:hypothetical protein [Senimuribacter intestinalis]